MGLNSCTLLISSPLGVENEFITSFDIFEYIGTLYFVKRTVLNSISKEKGEIAGVPRDTAGTINIKIMPVLRAIDQIVNPRQALMVVEG